MSDPYLSMQRQIQAQADQLEPLRKADQAALYLPWSQRVINPFPLASSGGVWGDSAQPWEVYILAFLASVFVTTTNSATQFWTIALLDSATSTTLASFTTAAISPNVFTRLSTTTITQPGASNPSVFIRPTATLSPGSLYIAPAVPLLRVGN